MKLTWRRLILPMLVGGLLTCLFGCGRGSEDKAVSKVVVLAGADQCALPGQPFAATVQAELLGRETPGLLGGEGGSDPITGVRAFFRASPGSDLRFEPDSAVSSAGGAVRTRVIAGKTFGDQYFSVIPEGFSDAARVVRVVAGVKITGNKQEAGAKNYLPEPVRVTLIGSDGKPVVGAPVFFTLMSSPEKENTARVEPSRCVTDMNGEAECRVKVGGKTGAYKILAEIDAAPGGKTTRGIEITALGLNVTGLIITVLGGLALFILGMNLMSEGLQLIAGEKMKNTLQLFTRNRVVAVTAGTVVTGIIQSSSACTVMVVGFVNAGLLTLTQAIGIIFGANIGTTATAQIISFNLGCLALPSIVIGLAITMFPKRMVIRNWGQAFLGFGLLFFGLDVMSEELKLISDFPTFIEFFRRFDCSPVNGHMPFWSVLGAIGIGTAMTVIIQSSSATIGIALALAVGGLLNFYTAVPLILGDNIGTTITALLASLAANRRAKQAAVAHTLFNVIGTVYMVTLFYVPFPGTSTPVFLYFINAITSGDVFAVIPENISRHIAMAHTMFNVVNVIVFLPFVNQIAKLCNLILPIRDAASVRPCYLEPHLLNTPSIAIEQTILAIRHMVKESWSMVVAAMNELYFTDDKKNEKLEAELMEREEKIDATQKEVTEYLARLTQQRLTEPQSEIIPLLMHCVNDAEKIADHTENIVALSRRLREAKHKLSEEGVEELREMWRTLTAQAENVIGCLESTDTQRGDIALQEEKVINQMADRYERSHIKRLRKGKCDVVSGIIFIETLNELEKIGDHFSNVAERAPEIQKHHVQLT